MKLFKATIVLGIALLGATFLAGSACRVLAAVFQAGWKLAGGAL